MKTSRFPALLVGNLVNDFMNDILAQFKSSIQRLTANLKEELKGIRTGRANPGMVESIMVETYGGSAKMKLNELSTITNDGNNALAIMVFDPATVADIEKAIMTSPLGINPQTEGTKIILRIPPLSEEQRTKYTKFVSQIIEETKNKIRNERDESRKKIKRMEDAKEVTEDERYRSEKEIDHITSTSNEELQKIKENKEKEIMEV